jgi:hypothetical protein
VKLTAHLLLGLRSRMPGDDPPFLVHINVLMLKQAQGTLLTCNKKGKTIRRVTETITELKPISSGI